MFRSKEPFGGQETIDARLIETNKGINVLSSQCVKFVKDRSDEFTNYLLYAWERDGTVILKNEELLKALQNVEVTRKDGQLSLLREFYLPLPKFVFLQARYMPPNENFKFLDLDPKLSSITLGHGHFSGLTSVFRNKDGTVEFPRRVFELYLRWQAVYEAGGEKIRVEVRINDLSLHPTDGTAGQFYGKAPKNPPSVISGSTLLPPPKEWEVSNSELAALEKFYRETLEIMDGEVESILLEFNKELDFKRAKEVYHTLQIMEPGLAKDDAKRIRITRFVHLIAKDDLLESKIFQVLGKDGFVQMFSVSKPFYIIDREYLHGSFREQVDVLDIDHTTFWLLEPFFIRMGFKSRFHRNNLIMEPASLTPGSVNWQATPVMDPERVDGFLRSFRTKITEEIASLERHLEMTKIHYLDEGDVRCNVFIKGLPSTSYETSFSPFYIHKRRNHRLNIYISKQSAEVTTSVELPRSLAAWLMGDSKHPDAKQADPKFIYLVGTVLRVRYHKLSAIKDILDGEGIVDVDKLQCSIYHPQSQ
ncbi:hypothetical protein FOC4_g10003520 [Fusarium odoratissimum]|uniref:Uncharacterized protein n=1 Tax=Fusarium oxysporum f. sp. cubense (strain race 4) TaxID=2502994 RepID=N1RN22_FUSC4|nr:hypothetical protein FOC4_g10003520 [Fusarium odoratissimum]